MKNTIEKLTTQIKSKEISCVELVKYYFDQIEKYNDKNAVIETFSDAIEIAKEFDNTLENTKNTSELPELFGVPILIKDNILYNNKVCSCGSKFLKDYVAQYTSTALNNLLNAGVIVIGRTNMDEFAMGGSCENSYYGPTKNALDDTLVAGGSSGGSATATALDLCCFALGSDTGGSVRQPASFNGIVGVKPTYGTVSRFGLVAYGSSLDQIGPITKNVEDSFTALKLLTSYDINDGTSIKRQNNLELKKSDDLKGKTIGIIKELNSYIENSPYSTHFENLKNWLTKNGATIKEISIPDYELALATYYILAPAEASSNLGRFDGIKYTRTSKDAKNIEETYIKSRTEGFGKEVKRRIMLGNFVLSSGYYDAYYKKAKNIKLMLKQEFKNAFADCDSIIMPTTYAEAFKIGEKVNDPVNLYAQDLYTIVANLVGIPALSMPFAKNNNMPLGLQILADHFDENKIYELAYFIEKNYKED